MMYIAHILTLVEHMYVHLLLWIEDALEFVLSPLTPTSSAKILLEDFLYIRIHIQTTLHKQTL